MTAFIDETLYRQLVELVPIPCVDIAIIADGAVLLVQRGDAPARGEWWLPGGRVHKGETMRQTAMRKAREEVGIDCHVGPIVHTAETLFPDGPHGIPVHSINSCFFLYPKERIAEPVLDNHHAAFRWVRSIPDGLHDYVTQCLRGAGLTMGSNDTLREQNI